MKPMNIILALALSSAVMIASAQMGAGPGPGAERGACMDPYGHWDPQKMRGHRDAPMAFHSKELHDKLKLNADQEEAWKAMEAAMMPPADQKRFDIADMEKLTAPERMEKMAERMQQHQQHMGTRLNAVKTLYGKLSPEQRKIFDQETLAPWKKLAERRAARRGAKPQTE